MNGPYNEDKIEREAVETIWDVIVVGTGMGGSSAGYAMARAGCRVLFLEKGHSHLNGQGFYDAFPESTFPDPVAPATRHRHLLAKAGRWSEEIVDKSGSNPSRIIPFMGTGTGGSSALYGMALERLFPCDFKPRSAFSSTGNSTIPETWPIEYETLKPYYTQAERLFSVAGSVDPLRRPSGEPPLRTPSPLNNSNAELFKFLKTQGMHPYRLPMGCDYSVASDHSQSVLDASGAKRDAARVCLEPAITEHGASLLVNCEVTKVLASRTRIKGLVCVRQGRVLQLRGRTVLLAAGALQTPRLLLASASRQWPHGLANQSGLVGRNLMRHLVNLYMLDPRCGEPDSGNLKQLAFNDFYRIDGMKLGTVQSFGMLPPAEVMVADLEWKIKKKIPGFSQLLLRTIRPMLHRTLASKRTRSLVIASIQEDLPYHDNSVGLSNQTDALGRRLLQIKYHPRSQDLHRGKSFNARINETLHPYRLTRVSVAHDNRHMAHACGTCRFGENPNESVLNPNNRAHGIENLFVVDASFMPSSGGTNPGLTIAANALRVAQRLLDRLGFPSQSIEEEIHRPRKTSSYAVCSTSEVI